MQPTKRRDLEIHRILRGVAVCVVIGAAPLLGFLVPADSQGLTHLPAATLRATDSQEVPCVKPWSIPDRWDDLTLVPGYPQWQNNGTYDQEGFRDLNENGVWEFGEPFDDRNTDGVYNQERYHPFETGYTGIEDHGRPLRLKMRSDPESGTVHLYALDLSGGGPTGAAAYRWNIANCYSGDGSHSTFAAGRMVGPTVLGAEELLGRDPAAYWDEGCQCVANSAVPISPRTGLLLIHDPRTSPEPGRRVLRVNKVIGIFLEGVGEDSEIRVRLMRISNLPSPGHMEPNSLESSQASSQGTPAKESTWGRVKAERR